MPSPLRAAHLPRLPETTPLSVLARATALLWQARFAGLNRLGSWLIDAVLRDLVVIIPSPGNANRAIQFRRARRISHNELFFTDSSAREPTKDLPGRSDRPVVLCVDGLGGRGAAWSEVARFVSRRLELPVHVRTLHDDRSDPVKALQNLTAERCIARITELVHAVQRPGQPTILLMHSFAGLVAKAVSRSLAPEQVVVVTVGTPFVVEGKHAGALTWLYRLHRLPPLRPLLQRVLVERPAPSAVPGILDDGFRLIPCSTYTTLAAVQEKVRALHRRRGLGPSIMFLGANDHYISERALLAYLKKGNRPSAIDVHVMPDLPHTPMLAPRRWRFVRRLVRIIEKVIASQHDTHR